MKGYIAVTDPSWFRYLLLNKHREVVFWRRSKRPVNLNTGDYLFFLVRGRLPRLIRGYGIVKNVGVNFISKIWQIFGEKNGCRSLEELEMTLHKPDSEKVAYYFLEKVVYLDVQSIKVTDMDLVFAKDIMAGKFISEGQSRALLALFSSGDKDCIRNAFKK